MDKNSPHGTLMLGARSWQKGVLLLLSECMLWIGCFCVLSNPHAGILLHHVMVLGHDWHGAVSRKCPY